MATTFKINGLPYTVNLLNFPADITLNTFIREHAQLTATKFMCLEGGCGVCICVIKGKHPVTGEMRSWTANSCLTLLNTCANWEIITSEGIGNKRIGYHPIQKRLAKMNGSQCGFCSPGMVMNMYGLLESKGGKVSMEEVENSFGGNICRCTGYRPILDAMKSFASDSVIEVPSDCQDIEDLVGKTCPKTGQVCGGTCHKPLTKLLYDDGSQWQWPKSLTELFEALDKVVNADYMLVAGNTAHGVYRRSPDIRNFIDVNGVAELKQHSIGNDKLTLGANLSLSDAMEIFLEAAKKPGFEYCQQLWQHFDLIANVPVRNTGTLAGNISIKKSHPRFQSDVYLSFEALNVQVVVNENATAQKKIPLSDYLQMTANKMVITAFELRAYPKDKFIYKSYKIMPRAQNAHAFVNAAFLVELDQASGKVDSARICFGGIRPNFARVTSIESMLIGQNLYDKETVAKIFNELPTTIQPDAVLPDALPEYRIKLACGLLYKFLLSTAPVGRVKEELKSGGEILKRTLSSGLQSFETLDKNFPVSQPVEKLEALIQCSGEATYMNDTLTHANAVYCAFVGAKKVGATIEQIDASGALKEPGVIAFYSAKDIPGDNTFCGTDFTYVVEEIFCSSVVEYFNQPLGLVVGLTSDIAHRAASKVKVIYSKGAVEVLPTMADVLEAKGVEHRVVNMVESPLKEVEFSGAPDIKGKGIFEVGLQYHFTMEPQTTIAVPFEEGLQIWSATQWMDHTQSVIAKMLNLPVNAVQLRVRRLGGGYGAKITRGNHVACAAALAAHKLNRPVRFVQTIESMMNCNGKRWACKSDYEFHAKSDGKIVGLRNSFWEDAGCTLNENPIPELALETVKNCYEFTANNFKVDAKAVLTDASSNTWCRAPGTTEGISMIENTIEHIAFEANLDPADVRLVNILPGNKMAQLLPRFLKSTEYRQRHKEIHEFNEKNRWIKRGLGLAVSEYPIFYIGQFPATVAIYHADGSVVVTHGGIEMGQGMNTKVAQVAAFILGIPLDKIKIETSDTINGANCMFSAASISTESVCFAVRKACNTLNERLKPIKDSLKIDASWGEIVRTAFTRQINMIASDQYKRGDMQPYSVHGCGLTEIEVDILTGNNQIRRVDILEDTGESLSPYIDIGQVEGAFVMSLGYWLTEQLVYDRQTGELLTNRTWNYKPPGAKDIPIDFRIELLQKNPNPTGFMRSKAIGEPPCCLAVGAVFAIQHAIQSARKDAGLKREWVRLGAPTTPETIVLNAGSDVKTFSLDQKEEEQNCRLQ